MAEKEVCRNLMDLARPLFEEILSFQQQIHRGIQPAFGEVRRVMRIIFDRMDSTAQKDARISSIYAGKEEAGKYILAAFVDDILSNSEWEFAEEWQNHWLEDEFFGTRMAGDNIPELVEKVTGKEEEAGLAELLFTCFTLGYRGKFARGMAELEMMREQMYSRIPWRPSHEDGHLTPQAYDYTVERESRLKRPFFTFMNICVLSIMAIILVLTIFGINKSKRAEALNKSLESSVKTFVVEKTPPGGN